jgi:hypothetical protein
MALGSTQPLTEMSTSNLPWVIGWLTHKADNITTICEPILWKMWELRRLTTLRASMAYYMDSFTFYFILLPTPRSFQLPFTTIFIHTFSPIYTTCQS